MLTNKPVGTTNQEIWTVWNLLYWVWSLFPDQADFFTPGPYEKYMQYEQVCFRAYQHILVNLVLVVFIGTQI